MNKFKSLFQYVSDIHLEMRKSTVWIKAQKPYLILPGDIGYPQQLIYKEFLHEVSNNFEKVFILSGNHEYDLSPIENINQVDELIENICQTRNNLIYLQKKIHCIDSSLNLYLSGCTFWATLPKSKYHLHTDHKTWLEKVLMNKKHKYIVATHHCPHFQCLQSKYKVSSPDYFATDQSELIKKSNVVAWIHGHSHNNRDFSIFNKEILSNQYGSQLTPLYRYKRDF